ncbi:MAG: hypothetical protein JO261_02335 [Alphaproteobacteria bacterium]|nr:hypothetical protein [Alphaproteobacteria bacterium]
MTISRREALGWASAFALADGLVPAPLLAAAGGAPKLSTQTAQRFLELLIHHDEDGHAPHTAMISIAAPDTGWYAIDTLDGTKYAALNRHNKKHGFRLKRVSGFDTRQGVRYAAIWEQAAGPDWHSRHGMDRSGFEAACAQFNRQGYRLVHVDARQSYTAVWEKRDPGAQQWFSALTPGEIRGQFGSLGANGLRPTRLSLSALGSNATLAAIFDVDGGRPWLANPLMKAHEFQRTGAQMTAQGYRLCDASGLVVSGKPHFSGIWEKA